MADYSGAYTCPECGAGGTYYVKPEHSDTCSVPEQTARAARRQALQEREKAIRLAEIRAEWDEYDDDDLIEELKAHRKVQDSFYQTYSTMDTSYRQGLDIIKERGLIQRWLNR